MITIGLFMLIGSFFGFRVYKRAGRKDLIVVVLWLLIGLLIGISVAAVMLHIFPSEYVFDKQIKMVPYETDKEIEIDFYLVEFDSHYKYLREKEDGSIEQIAVFGSPIHQEEREDAVIDVFRVRFKSKFGSLFTTNLISRTRHEIFIPKNSILKVPDSIK